MTDGSGNYSITNLTEGVYHVEFDPCNSPADVLGEWYNDKPSEATSDDVTVAEGVDVDNIDAELPPAGSISGTVLTAHLQPAVGGIVYVHSGGSVVEAAAVQANGTYTARHLTTGTYEVEFIPPAGSLDLSEYYLDQHDPAEADPVTVTEPDNTSGIDATLDGDTTPPVVTINGGPSGPTKVAQPTFSFSTEAGATLECSIDTGTPSWGPCSGDPTSHTPASPLADGPYTFRVQATDPSTNVGSATQSFSVDTQAPSLSITGGPNGLTGIVAPTFTFTAEAGANLECAIDLAGAGTPSWGPCDSATSHSSAPLADGDWVFSLRATDAATNAATVQRTFTVDSDGPNLSITGGPNGATNDATPTHTFSSSESWAMECAVDPQGTATPSWGPCTALGTNTATALADGDYVFSVKATDDALNTTTAQRSFSVDTVAPAVTIDSGPSGLTNDPVASFGFTSDESNVECSLDTGTPSWGTCSAPDSYDGGTLADGAYVFRVRATDSATNATTATQSFTIDTNVTLSITSGPNGPTNDSTPTFNFNSESGATVECSIDTGTPSFGSCSGPGTHTAVLGNGPFTFRVRATDPATNVKTLTRDFSVDTVAPAVSITSGPAGETDNPSPTFTFNAESGSAVQCSLDAGVPAFGPCSSGSSYTPPMALSDGSYTFRVRATDAATNSSVAIRGFDLDVPTAPPPPPDTTPPTIDITSGPKSKTKDKTPTFEFDSNDTFATFKCTVDKGAAAACKSPTTLKKLKPGKHTFLVTATDRTGNESAPATQSFTVKKKKKK